MTRRQEVHHRAAFQPGAGRGEVCARRLRAYAATLRGDRCMWEFLDRLPSSTALRIRDFCRTVF